MLSFSLFNTIIISRWNLKSLWISLILFFFVKSWLGENNGIQVVVETIKWGGYFSSRPFLRNSNIRLAADLLWFFLCSPQKQLSMSWKTTNFKQKTLINQTVRSYHNRHRVNVRIRLLKKKPFTIMPVAKDDFSHVSLLCSLVSVCSNQHQTFIQISFKPITR